MYKCANALFSSSGMYARARRRSRRGGRYGGKDEASSLARGPLLRRCRRRRGRGSVCARTLFSRPRGGLRSKAPGRSVSRAADSSGARTGGEDAGRDAERDGVDASRRSVLVLVAVRRCRSGVVAVLGVLVLVAVRRHRSGIVSVLGVLVLVPVAAVAVLLGLGGRGLRGSGWRARARARRRGLRQTRVPREENARGGGASEEERGEGRGVRGGRTWRVACASHDAGASATSASATSATAWRKARRSMSSRVVRS